MRRISHATGIVPTPFLGVLKLQRMPPRSMMAHDASASEVAQLEALFAALQNLRVSNYMLRMWDLSSSVLI